MVREDGQEVRLYCREAQETAMVVRFAQGFEAGLQKPRAEKRHDKLLGCVSENGKNRTLSRLHWL